MLDQEYIDEIVKKIDRCDLIGQEIAPFDLIKFEIMSCNGEKDSCYREAQRPIINPAQLKLDLHFPGQQNLFC